MSSLAEESALDAQEATADLAAGLTLRRDMILRRDLTLRRDLALRRRYNLGDHGPGAGEAT